jgi:hypothetical protein
MKFPALLLGVALLALPARAALQNVFYIGVDNNTQSEFEQENAQLAHYYWENGNYTVFSPAENWTGGQETFGDQPGAATTNALGFPRALTTGYTQTNIYFMLDAAEAGLNQPMRLVVDIISLGGGSVHDLDVRLNNAAPFAAQTGIAGNQTWTIDTTAGAMGAVTGPNVLRIRRTGGAGGASPWIQFDYIHLQADPAAQYISTFVSNDYMIRPGEAAALSWTLFEPAATVSITPGIGDVTHLTSGGAGSIEGIAPTANTTYTLTATHNGQSQTRTVTINYSPWEGIFEAGIDNASNAEFSHEVAADDDYYFAGDYTSAGGPNQAAHELLNDDTDTNTAAGRTGNPAIGFERAVAEFDPHTNIWFVPNPAQVNLTARHRITVDVNSVGSAGGGTQTHNMEVLLNDKLLHTRNNITGATPVQFEVTGLTSGMKTGPNKLTIRRTGGTLAGYIVFDFVMMEYLAGAEPPAVTVTDDPILGTHTIAWAAAAAKTYRVQKSTDTGATWTDMAAGFPTGGASSASLFYEDRVTPYTDPRPDYRVLLE